MSIVYFTDSISNSCANNNYNRRDVQNDLERPIGKQYIGASGLFKELVGAKLSGNAQDKSRTRGSESCCKKLYNYLEYS